AENVEGDGLTVGEGDAITVGDDDIVGDGDGGGVGTPFCTANASLFANSSVNQIRFCVSTFNPSCGCGFDVVGAAYTLNEPVPVSRKEPKMPCWESSNQT